MSLNFNRIYLSGRLTSTPELKTTQTQKMVCSFDVAYNKDKNTAYYFTCIAWDKKAEFVARNFTKGAPIFVEGELTTRKFTDRNNNERTAYEIRVVNVFYEESKEEKDLRLAAPADMPIKNEEDVYVPMPNDDALPF